MKRVGWFLLVLVLLGAGSWWQWGRARGPRAGYLTLEWGGSSRGKAQWPAELFWCPVTRVGTLEAISNDTGLVVTLHERDSLAATPHPVMALEFVAGLPRPVAVAALRWVSDSVTMKGFKSVGGTIDITQVGTAASGRLELKLRQANGPDSLLILGSFDNVPVTATAVGCS